MKKKVRKWFILFSGIFLGLLWIYFQKSEPRFSSQDLILGLCADYPPFEYKKKNEILGFDIDLAREIAKRLGKNLVIQDMDFFALISALQSGRVDLVMAGMTITSEREKNVDFSIPYFETSFALICLQESPLAHEIDFRGKKIGTQLGSVMEQYLKSRLNEFPGMKLVILEHFSSLIQELRSKRLDGVLTEEVQANALSKAQKELKSVLLGKISEGYAIAFRKSKEASLKKQVNQILLQLKKDKFFVHLKQKWF